MALKAPWEHFSRPFMNWGGYLSLFFVLCGYLGAENWIVTENPYDFLNLEQNVGNGQCFDTGLFLN